MPEPTNSDSQTNLTTGVFQEVNGVSTMSEPANSDSQTETATELEEHKRERRKGDRRCCMFCRVVRSEFKKTPTAEDCSSLGITLRRPVSTSSYCSVCDVPLCIATGCWEAYHARISDETFQPLKYYRSRKSRLDRSIPMKSGERQVLLQRIADLIRQAALLRKRARAHPKTSKEMAAFQGQVKLVQREKNTLRRQLTVDFKARVETMPEQQIENQEAISEG